ncbi:TlpA disulfide reductase family protein [uncultured Psychroserpens sp.]|uniref:TlpA family protein disulfide reductase n=1 Tax=uncultured Psychroserpens sp. TaxID=255436 RepID=UPI00261A610B|nr:TlpA disulfide reductase family protein [uncultured Psychroserpens sp.]
MKKQSFIILFALLCPLLSVFAQESINRKSRIPISIESISLNDILNKSREALSSIESIKYQIIQQKTLKERYGQPYIDAIFTCQKDSTVKDVGFGKAKLKAQGTIELNGKKEDFSFSYDGNTFKYSRGTIKNKVIKSPTRKIVMGYLQQHLFMLQAFPYTDEVPYMPLGFGYKYEGIEMYNGEKCFKVKTTSAVINTEGEIVKGKRIKIWYISTDSFLPIGFSDEKFYKQEISIKNINKSDKKPFKSKSANENTMSVSQARMELAGEKLLKLMTNSPKWIAKDQDGKIWNSVDLKGKVVFIDFWGSWCAPCKKAMPQIEKLYKHYRTNKEVIILGISAAEKNSNASTKYFNDKKYSYTHIPNGDDIAKTFKVEYYPTVYILNKEGKISYYETDFSQVGFNNWTNIIDKLLN